MSHLRSVFLNLLALPAVLGFAVPSSGAGQGCMSSPGGASGTPFSSPGMSTMFQQQQRQMLIYQQVMMQRQMMMQQQVMQQALMQQYLRQQSPAYSPNGFSPGSIYGPSSPPAAFYPSYPPTSRGTAYTTRPAATILTSQPDRALTDEERAAGKLKSAKMLLEHGLKADAREYLDEIVAKFAATAAAEEAGTLLKTMPTAEVTAKPASLDVAVTAASTSAISLRQQLRAGPR